MTIGTSTRVSDFDHIYILHPICTSERVHAKGEGRGQSHSPLLVVWYCPLVTGLMQYLHKRASSFIWMPHPDLQSLVEMLQVHVRETDCIRSDLDCWCGRHVQGWLVHVFFTISDVYR